jgi:uncharacterized protein YkwD
MGCRHNYWYSQGAFRCKKCGHITYKSYKVKRKNKKTIILIPTIIGILIVGVFVYQQYGNHVTPNMKIGEPQEFIINSITKTVTSTIENPTNNPITNTITNTVKNNPVTNTITNTVSNLQPKPDDVNAIALDIHNLINEQRKANGLQPLNWNPTLSTVALNHSNDMAKRNYFDHTDPEGHDFLYRYSQVGFNCQIPTSSNEYSEGGENIMWLEGYYGEQNIASQTVTGWMNSSGHRHNILTSYFQSEGIGVSKSADGKIYATEDFC